jgi:hypothetical protein
MEEDLAGARKREAGFKNERGRRKRWFARQWRISALGNQFLNSNDGFNVVVYPKGSFGKPGMEDCGSGYQRTSKLPYHTQDQAKLAAFDAIIGMKHSEPWRHRRSAHKMRRQGFGAHKASSAFGTRYRKRGHFATDRHWRWA